MKSVLKDDEFGLGLDGAKANVQATLRAGDGRVLRRSRFPNTAEGAKALASRLGTDPGSTRAVIEATGRYHRVYAQALRDAGMEVVVVNPRRARALAEGLGKLDKDDRVDADVLSSMALLLQKEEIVVPSLLAQDLRDHSRMIQTLKEDAAKYKKRLDGLSEDSAAYKAGKEAVKALGARVRAEEGIWKNKAQEEPEVHRRYRLALSVKGVGHVTSRVVSVELPADLKKPLKKILAYAGIVARREQSGNKELPARIMGGNAHLRTALFMPATTLSFGGRRYASIYKALSGRERVPVRTKGGWHLKAVVALMRRLLSEIVSVIQRDTPWTQERPPKELLLVQAARSEGKAKEIASAALTVCAAKT